MLITNIEAKSLPELWYRCIRELCFENLTKDNELINPLWKGTHS